MHKSNDVAFEWGGYNLSGVVVRTTASSDLPRSYACGSWPSTGCRE